MREDCPVVSVCIITYNHEHFIADCIEGVLMQQVDFPYEIVIGEDISTDGTREVCKTYAAKYPGIIRLLERDENLGMKKNWVETIRACQGRYVALCEGDDYWIDPNKLQKQVDLMEQHKDYVLSFTNTDVTIEVEETASNAGRGLEKVQENRVYTGVEILEKWLIPTPSVLFRRNALTKPYFELAVNEYFIYADIVLYLFLSDRGYLYGMTDTTVMYRRHEGGVMNINRVIQFDRRYYSHLSEIVKQFGAKVKTPKIKRALSRLALSLALNNLSEKKYFVGIKLLFASIGYNKGPFLKYLKSKV